jgi:hypothetical protein
MPILRPTRVVTTTVLIAVLAVELAAQSVPNCLRPFYTDIIGPAGLAPANAYRLFRKVGRYNPQAQNGVVAMLASPSELIDHDTVDQIIESFGSVVVDFNALRTDEGIFEVVGQLSPTELKPGLDRVLSDLAMDTDPAEKGASFTLLMAKQIAGENPARISAFEVEYVTGSRVRRIDIVENCAPCPPGVTAILHENKNWTTALSGATDIRLVRFADEFRRDILLHADSSFAGYRLNLRTTVQGQDSLLKSELLRQFDDPSIVDELGQARQSAARDAFEAAWNSGTLVRYFTP